MEDKASDIKSKEQVEENNNAVPEKIKSMIANPTDLLKYVTESGDAFEVINPIAWEATGLIMAYLKDESVSENLNLYEKCLAKIAELAFPKELYLGILEHFDPAADAKYVELLIPALSTVIEKLYEDDIKACATILETTYSTVVYYIGSLNLPEYKSFDPLKKRTKVFEAQKIERILAKLCAALRPVIANLCRDFDKHSQEFAQFRCHTFRCLCDVLVVLGQLDLEAKDDGYGEEMSNLAENVVEKVDRCKTERENIAPDTELVNQPNHVISVAVDTMEMVSLLYSPFFLWDRTHWYCLQPVEEHSAEGKLELERQVERGHACYLFLLFSRGILLDALPQVYSHYWLLIRTMHPLITLLACDNQCVTWKGLEIFKHILDRTEDVSLSCVEIQYHVRNLYNAMQKDLLTANPVEKLFQQLINIAVYLPSKTVRTRAVRFVPQFLDKFIWGDKYFLLKHLLATTEHSGVQGLLIGYLKDKLNEILQSDPPCGHQQFCDSKKLALLGETIFTLSEGAETDLLADCDRIMAALNLLRFLIIRDKENKTGVRNHFDRIEKEFLKPMRIALDMSRAHYENELKKYGKKRTTPVKTAENEPEFSVNGMPLPNLPLEEQRSTLKAALHSFDMMEIVMVRVGELMT